MDYDECDIHYALKYNIPAKMLNAKSKNFIVIINNARLGYLCYLSTYYIYVHHA